MKTYVARVTGSLAPEDLRALARGVHLDGKRTGGATVTVLRRGPQENLLELKISEGRNRQVRRILARLGHKVRRLHRSAIGPVTDRGLKIGKFRYLLAREVAALRKAAGM
jgi:pseudouridine synthase